MQNLPKNQMPYTYKHPHPSVTVDIVLFTKDQGDLQVLLIKRKQDPFKDRWALPGGFVEIDEDLGDCAKRELKEETGVTGVALEQVYTFGAPDRDPRGRVITVAYMGFVDKDKISLRAASDAKKAEWFSLDDLTEITFDHRQIIRKAVAFRLNQ